MKCPPFNRYLPGSFHYTRDEPLVGHLTEADSGKLEFAKKSARSAGELASVAQADGGRVLRHLVQIVDRSQPLFDGAGHVEDHGL